MKKKTFIQLHLSMIFINCFFLFLVSCSIIVRIKYPLMGDYTYKNFNEITTLILWYFSLLIVIWIGIKENHHWIVFKEKEIYVPNDLRLRCNKRQFKVVVRYDDILDISFITSRKNSKGKTIRDESSQPFAPSHHYLVIQKKNNRKERILLDYYSKKQKIKILEELERRLKYSKNLIDLTKARELLESLGPRERL